MIVTLFFGAAVLSMGGVYALVPSLMERPTVVLFAAIAALCVSLAFSMLIIGRTFWLVARAQKRHRG